jgi:hypothetical protein
MGNTKPGRQIFFGRDGIRGRDLRPVPITCLVKRTYYKFDDEKKNMKINKSNFN